MPDTRFTLIGKAVVWIVKASDSQLKKLLTKNGWKGIKKTKTKKKKKKLKPGIHMVEINGKKRKVQVLKNGQWRWKKNGR